MTLTGMVRTGAALRDVDLIAGLAALAWAIIAQGVRPFGGQLAELVDPRLAAGFGVVALGRWYARWSRR